MARFTDGPNPARPSRAWGWRSRSARRLDAYLDLLAAWNARVNLTGARTPAAQVDAADPGVLPLTALLLPGGPHRCRIGKRIAGLVLGILSPERLVTLLEPRTRRWAFLREAARAVGRPDIQVFRCRHDEFPGPPAPNVSVRALRLPLPELARLLAPGGRILVLGAAPQRSEGFRVRTLPTPGKGAVHVLERADVSRGTSGVA